MIRRLALLVALPLLAACGAEDADPVDAEPGPELPSGELMAADLPAPFERGDQLRVSFEDGQISFQATCNTMSGTARLEDEVLVVTSVGGTEMGCPGAGVEQDEWLIDFFTSRPTVETLDVGVALRGPSAELRLLPPEAVPDEDDLPLERTDWRLTGIEEIDGDSVGMTGVPGRLGARLLVEGDQILFDTGCNSGGGAVTVTDDRLELRGVGITLKGCPGVRGEIESAQLPVLMSHRVGWSVDGDQLRLTRGGTALLYTAR